MLNAKEIVSEFLLAVYEKPTKFHYEHLVDKLTDDVSNTLYKEMMLHTWSPGPYGVILANAIGTILMFRQFLVCNQVDEVCGIRTEELMILSDALVRKIEGKPIPFYQYPDVSRAEGEYDRSALFDNFKGTQRTSALCIISIALVQMLANQNLNYLMTSFYGERSAGVY